ncbi:uncharacterized protein BDW47DRAFT_123962 [Aspergillus candidus]|uniref:Uncharacterized protein n=1 Tax=Aspergillus candidus TaxID=41067 RepID=A0A2I2FHB4_ASPCN|nr:hypothetical protein BDW47DRAFT_123962 [Aspergillus candidus]PLB40021.1 hypothetical protein BDW47DRAFT_123962 [Aspergillus candidus]
MGSICSKSSNQSTEAFSRPGRPLGSSATGPKSSAPRAPLPKSASNFASPGRTLGGESSTKTSNSRVGTQTQTQAQPQTQQGAGVGDATAAAPVADPRANAAIAAQKRAESASAAGGKGKLGTKLAAQKAQTQSQTLNEVSRDERAARDADDAAAARAWS